MIPDHLITFAKNTAIEVAEKIPALMAGNPAVVAAVTASKALDGLDEQIAAVVDGLTDVVHHAGLHSGDAAKGKNLSADTNQLS